MSSQDKDTKLVAYRIIEDFNRLQESFKKTQHCIQKPSR